MVRVDGELHQIEIREEKSATAPSQELQNPVDTANEAQDLEAGEATVATSSPSRVTTSLGRLHLLGRRTTKVQFVVLLVAFIATIGASVGLTLLLTPKDNSSSSSINSSDDSSGGKGFPPSSATMAAEKSDFLRLDVDLSSGETSLAIQKTAIGKSFIVYASIDRKSGPPEAGLERGAMITASSDYAFHFDLSSDGTFLLLELENHNTRLIDPSIQQIFDDSQWPGYIIGLPIVRTTTSTYYISTDYFFQYGFFVVGALGTQYMVQVDNSNYGARTANIFAEYWTEDLNIVVHYSLQLLPKTPLATRVSDDRIGFFHAKYIQYGVDPAFNDPKVLPGSTQDFWESRRSIIHRRRLEVDANGNALNPIKFHIDPSVPTKWRNYFKQGVETWNVAFEAAGIKKAIRAVLPTDSDWPSDYHIGDLRYDSISVMISSETYAIAPSVVDPRTGEILHSDILFDFGFFDEVVGDFYALSPAQPSSYVPSSKSSTLSPFETFKQHFSPERVDEDTEDKEDDSSSSIVKNTIKKFMKKKSVSYCNLSNHPRQQMDRELLHQRLALGMDEAVPDRLIGAHFSDIVMHEVGHSLGLRHNFAGTTSISRGILEDESLVVRTGLSASIMDYTPVNIWSNLTDAEAKKQQFYVSTVGEYDIQAIKYGYLRISDEKAGYKHQKLSELAQQAPLFLTDEDVNYNPMAQQFDLSSDPLAFFEDRVVLIDKLRKTLVSKIPEDESWTVRWRHERMYLHQLRFVIEDAVKFIGGVKVSHAHKGKNQPKYQAPLVTKADQLRALKLLTRIISADTGIFMAPTEYTGFIDTVGFEDEDCAEPSVDAACLGKALVNMDKQILTLRQQAIVQALIGPVDRIIALDVNAPVKLSELFSELNKAVTKDTSKAQNLAVLTFFQDLMAYIAEKTPDGRVVAEAIKYLPK